MLLQACPHCSRQYEVAHLEPGSQVHCICDVLFDVKHPRDLRVRGLICKHCGAPVSADHEECTYCSAALDERDRNSAMCPSCLGQLDSDAAHCSACGTKIDPQALPPIPAGTNCPRCKSKLQIRSLEITSVIECSDCSGLWLEPKVFQRICVDAQTGKFNLDHSKGDGDEKPSTREAQSYIPCLDCGELMLRRQFKHQSRSTGIVLDYCRNHGIWFDGEELASALLSIQNGTSESVGTSFIDEAMRPSLKVRKTPDIMSDARPRKQTYGYVDIARFLGDLIF